MGTSGRVRGISVALLAIAPLIFLFGNCGRSFELKDSSSSAAYMPDCEKPSFEVTLPLTIDETTTLINQLPKPLTLECFLYYLPRPLSVHATTSNFSAQPSDSPENPRIFIVNPGTQIFLMSVVPTGLGKYLLEMSQFQSQTTSVKAELAFPVTGTLAAATPYSNILEVGGGTSCKFCHQNEMGASGSWGGSAFVSEVLRPDTARRVSLSEMTKKAKTCDKNSDPYRCAILNSIYGVAPLKEVSFP
jgi:hypothetical protein